MRKNVSEQADSFSSKVKTELSGLKIKRFEDARALLCAFTLGIGTLKFVPGKKSWGVHYSIKSRDAIELCAKLCAQYYALEFAVSEVKHERLNANNCELIVYGGGIDEFMCSVGMMSLDENGEKLFSPSVPLDAVRTDTQKRAFIRGLFLACGTVSDPEKAYHLEFVINNEALAEKAFEILYSYDIPPNRSKRRSSAVMYVKEGEKLEDLLAFIGASEGMMRVSQERIIKQAKNRANRYVNCTEANANRSADAARKQLENIELLLKTLGAEALGEELKVVALSRMNNPELSLSELADELEMGRSAVNYRLKKLERIAEEIRGREK